MAEVTFGKHTTQWITISLDEYESLRRTIEILSDRELMEQIEGGRKDKKAGKVRDFAIVAKELGI